MITITQTFAGNFIIPPVITNRRSQGIPSGGPADLFLSKIVLHLAQSTTCLEITTPITLTTTEPTQIALAAPPNSQPLPNHPTTSLAFIPLLPGEPLTLQSPKTGYRIYLSWPGLISHSRFPQLLTGNLQITASTAPSARQISLDPTLISLTTSNLAYVPYQEEDQTEEERQRLPEIPCVVTPHISRIGTRINPQTPEPLKEGSSDINASSILIKKLSAQTLPRSEPSILGAIQVTPSSELLIHGPDGPTLGGYPKLGAIIQADLSTLAQLRPGQTTILTPITIEEAHQFRLNHQQKLAQTLTQIDKALRIAQF